MSTFKHPEKTALPTAMVQQFYCNSPAVIERSAAMIKYDDEAALCLRWLQID